MGAPCPCHSCPVRDIGIFSHLDADEFFKIKDLAHQTFYKKYQTIFYEDNPCHGFYVLRSGRAKLIKSSRTGRQQILKLVNPSELIGADAIFENGNYSFTAEVLEDSETCFINKEEFFRFINERPGVAVRMIALLSGELRTARAQILDMALKDAKERMASLILGLAEQYGSHDKDGVHLGLALRRCEMADMIGVSQETAIRLLSDFKESGLIKTDRREITIVNEKGVRAIAGS